jgi:hypothetical protein
MFNQKIYKITKSLIKIDYTYRQKHLIPKHLQ